jgi:tRNA dimethylallyltransferase
MPSIPLNQKVENPKKTGIPERMPLVVIIGPTAVGKTNISIQLAERLDGEIISADSRLFYIGMDIGTAKPSPDDRARVPHHLIDVAEPDETWSLAVFQKQGFRSIEDILVRGHLPFIVGGTGQYIRAVIQGWNLPEVEPHPSMRAVLEKWSVEIGYQGLHDRLAVLDPDAASNIDPRNLRRTVRALEVTLSTGRRFSTQRRRGKSPYDTLLLGLTRPRTELYTRIDSRIETMIETGLIAEVQVLLDRGYSTQLPAFSAIGYREIISYLEGEITLDEAVEQIKRATRTFVRRQANWFKKDDPDIIWFTIGQNTVDELEKTITAWYRTLK